MHFEVCTLSIKSSCFDFRNAFRENDFFQGLAVLKRCAANLGYTVRQHDLLDLFALVKSAACNFLQVASRCKGDLFHDPAPLERTLCQRFNACGDLDFCNSPKAIECVCTNCGDALRNLEILHVIVVRKRIITNRFQRRRKFQFTDVVSAKGVIPDRRDGILVLVAVIHRLRDLQRSGDARVLGHFDRGIARHLIVQGLTFVFIGKGLPRRCRKCAHRQNRCRHAHRKQKADQSFFHVAFLPFCALKRWLPHPRFVPAFPVVRGHSHFYFTPPLC